MNFSLGQDDILAHRPSAAICGPSDLLLDKHFMKRYLILLLVLVARSAIAEHPIAVDSVAVKLFYQHSGRLSPPLLESDYLVNVFIGEYSLENDKAAEPSNTAIIDVSVSLPAGENAFGDVELTITDLDTKKVMLRQVHSTGTFDRTGISHVAFLYSEIGCSRLQFEASANTAKFKNRSKPRGIILPFGCHSG